MEVLGVNETAVLFEMRGPLDQLFSAVLSLVLRGASEAIFILKGHLYRNKHPLQTVLFVWLGKGFEMRSDPFIQ